MIRWYAGSNIGEPDVDYFPLGNGFTYKAGDALGMMSGTSAQSDGSPAGTLRRLGASVGGSASAFPIVLASGIWGFCVDDATADANGNAIQPALLSGVIGNVQPALALSSYPRRVWTSPSIAGAVRNVMRVALATPNNYFIQRHKKGTRVNEGLIGKQAALTYNATTLEFEVDTTAGNPSVVVEDMDPLFNDNRTYYDSATFATDAFGAWVVFRVLPSVQAQPNGLTYAS